MRDFAERTTLDADAGWRAQQERLRAADAFEPELRGTLRVELRPYQHDDFHWLARWGAGACLADDMGLGKTVQSLALLLDRAPDGPALVVAPTSVVANWLDEARGFTPTLDVIAYTGAAFSRTGRLDKLGPFDVVVTTCGLLQIDTGALSAVEWHSAVLGSTACRTSRSSGCSARCGRAACTSTKRPCGFPGIGAVRWARCTRRTPVSGGSAAAAGTGSRRVRASAAA